MTTTLPLAHNFTALQTNTQPVTLHVDTVPIVLNMHAQVITPQQPTSALPWAAATSTPNTTLPTQLLLLLQTYSVVRDDAGCQTLESGA